MGKWVNGQIVRKWLKRRWRLVYLWFLHQMERSVHAACFSVWSGLYYWGEYPGASRGNFLDGVGEACWTRVSGHGVRFSFGVGWIYWEHLLIMRFCKRVLAWLTG